MLIQKNKKGKHTQTRESNLYTVEPLYNGHLGDRRKWPLWSGARYGEVGVAYDNAKKALKHTYQLRGMANTVRMRTTKSPGQWQPWTAVWPFLGFISMA